MYIHSWANSTNCQHITLCRTKPATYGDNVFYDDGMYHTLKLQCKCAHWSLRELCSKFATLHTCQSNLQKLLNWTELLIWQHNNYTQQMHTGRETKTNQGSWLSWMRTSCTALEDHASDDYICNAIEWQCWRRTQSPLPLDRFVHATAIPICMTSHMDNRFTRMISNFFSHFHVEGYSE